MEVIKEVFSLIAEIIDIIGVTVLVLGFIKLLFKYIVIEFTNKITHTAVEKLQMIRCEIGVYILLALDLLIASDIITTILEINQVQLMQLGAIVIIRTAIGYFLGKEIEEIKNAPES